MFETNSSSTHSLIIMTNSQFKKWKAGKILYRDNLLPWSDNESVKAFRGQLLRHDRFFTAEEVENIKKFYAYHGVDVDGDYKGWDYYFQTYDQWCQSEDFDVTDYKYTTPKGEKIVAVAKYGWC